MTPQETAHSALAATLHANTFPQIMPLQSQNPGAALLGCSSVNCSSALDLRSAAVQHLSTPMAQCVNAADRTFQGPLVTAQYQGRPMLSKDMVEAQGSAFFNGYSSSPQLLNFFESSAQRGAMLGPGSLMPNGMQRQCHPMAYPSFQQQQSLSSTNVPMLETPDQGRRTLRNNWVAEEKLSTNDKSPGSSSKSMTFRTKWKPNAHQLEILEHFFNSGATRATPELYAAVQGCGHATEHNVDVWLKNRSSRRKKSVTKKQSAIREPREEESDDETPWEDFKVASRHVMCELNQIFTEVDRSDVLVLARAIQEAKQICCFGVGKEALVMKAFASGLHHLGFACFFIDDTNTPQIDKTTLVLISAGPSSGSRISGMLEEACSAGARIIAFSSHKQFDAQRVFTVQVPTRSVDQAHVGTDGEVMSAVPNATQDNLPASSLFDLSVTLLCDCVCVMLRKAGAITPAKIRARHTNLE